MFNSKLQIVVTVALFVFLAGLQTANAAWQTVIDENWDQPTTDWSYFGPAARVDNRLRLTPAVSNNYGWAFYDTTIPSDHFRAEFDFETYGGTGADVINFQWQPNIADQLNNNPPLYAVEFDEWVNTEYPIEYELRTDHVAFNDSRTPSSQSSCSVSMAAMPTLDNTGVWHAAIEFHLGHVQVWASHDKENMVQYIDYQLQDYTSFDNAYFGFYGECGARTNNHVIDNFVLQVPEPGTMLMLVIGGLGLFRRRK